MHLEIHRGFSSTRSNAKVCVLHCINVKVVLKLVCKWSNINLVSPYSCILLLKEETSRSGLKYILVVDSYRNYKFICFYNKTYGLKAVSEDPLDCLQVPEIHSNLLEVERMDHYLFYDQTLTTSCGIANIIAFLLCFFSIRCWLSECSHTSFSTKVFNCCRLKCSALSHKQYRFSQHAGVFF